MEKGEDALEVMEVLQALEVGGGARFWMEDSEIRLLLAAARNGLMFAQNNG